MWREDRPAREPWDSRNDTLVRNTILKILSHFPPVLGAREVVTRNVNSHRQTTNKIKVALYNQRSGVEKGRDIKTEMFD